MKRAEQQPRKLEVTRSRMDSRRLHRVAEILADILDNAGTPGENNKSMGSLRVETGRPCNTASSAEATGKQVPGSDPTFSR